MLDIRLVREAAERLRGVAHRTPIVTSTMLDDLTGARVFLKAENFQRIGAFKFRGAYNKIASLPAEQRQNGVLAWSSGNHAQAVALAAKLHGICATIVMPKDAPPLKRRATEGYGARIVEYDRYTESREEIGAALARDEGLVVVAPYDDWQVMAGQGTVALELVADLSTVDVLIAPVGGGGLMAGCGVAARAEMPGIELIGAEPSAGNDTALSLAKGERVTIDVPRTIADGQGATTPGEFTFEVNKRQVDDVILVEDAEIIAAMAFLFERTKMVVEPSGATGIAALLKSGDRFAGRRVGVVLSGGNIGVAEFAELISGRADPDTGLPVG